MNVDDLYLADPTAEKGTYIQFMMLVFELQDIPIMLKVGNDEYIYAGETVTVWKWSKRFEPISIKIPPLLDVTEHSRQLFSNNGEEIFTLYEEAISQGAYEEIEEGIIRIKVFNYRKAHNIKNTELLPKNRWVVYNGDNLPDFYQSILGRYFEG